MWFFNGSHKVCWCVWLIFLMFCGWWYVGLTDVCWICNVSYFLVASWERIRSWLQRVANIWCLLSWFCTCSPTMVGCLCPRLYPLELSKQIAKGSKNSLQKGMYRLGWKRALGFQARYSSTFSWDLFHMAVAPTGDTYQISLVDKRNMFPKAVVFQGWRCVPYIIYRIPQAP